MKTKQIIKIIGLILLILFILIIIHTLRNYFIIKKLQNNFKKYLLSNNYHFISTNTENNAVITLNYYKKDKNEVAFFERKMNNETLKITTYKNHNNTNIFTDNGVEKTCQLGVSSQALTVNLYNYLETDNEWQTLFKSIFANVKKSTFNKKDCYIIKNFKTIPNTENADIYIQQDTGLLLKILTKNSKTERIYEFNNVEDSIFEEPSTEEYLIK